MSETEHNKGKLIPVDMVGDLEGTAKSIADELGWNKKEYYDNYIELLEEEGYRHYVTLKGVIYKVEYKELDPDNDIFIATKNDDGSYDFETKYYNGGCSFNEAIETAVGKQTT